MIRFCVLKTPNIIMRTLRSKSVLYLRLNGQCKLHSNNQASKTKIKEDLSIHSTTCRAKHSKENTLFSIFSEKEKRMT